MENKTNQGTPKVVCIDSFKSKKAAAVNTPAGLATEEEISLLFCGLVRLIRNTAITEINQQLKRECEFATQNYHAALKVIAGRDEQIKKLKDINKTLNEKIDGAKVNLLSV